MIIKEVWDLVEELIKKKWQFDLVYTDMYTYGSKKYQKIKGMRWEADFTKRLKGGLWDNHESGVSKDDPNEAIKLAYDNIKTGKRLKKLKG